MYIYTHLRLTSFRRRVSPKSLYILPTSAHLLFSLDPRPQKDPPPPLEVLARRRFAVRQINIFEFVRFFLVSPGQPVSCVGRLPSLNDRFILVYYDPILVSFYLLLSSYPFLSLHAKYLPSRSRFYTFQNKYTIHVPYRRFFSSFLFLSAYIHLQPRLPLFFLLIPTLSSFTPSLD